MSNSITYYDVTGKPLKQGDQVLFCCPEYKNARELRVGVFAGETENSFIVKYTWQNTLGTTYTSKAVMSKSRSLDKTTNTVNTLFAL